MMSPQLVLLILALGVVGGQGNCPFGLYGQHPANSCICLQRGLWGIKADYCTTPMDLVGVDREFCFTTNQTVGMLEKVLGFEEGQVAQLSSSMHKLIDRFDKFSTTVPFREDIYQGHSTLITFGESKWTIRTSENHSYCLHHTGHPTNQYCTFPDIKFKERSLQIWSIQPQCEPNLPVIRSFHCDTLVRDQKCEEDNSLALDPLIELQKNELETKVKKREDSSTSSATSESLLIEDEDEISSDGEELGHKIMGDQMDQYVDTVVGELVGVWKEDAGAQERYPILKLLNLIKMIMQKTCSPVKGHFFQLALNTFLKVQLESLHVKEPYLSHNPTRRISYALKRCYNEARPHTFHSAPPSPQCPHPHSEVTTSELDVYGNGSLVVKLEGVPPSVSALVGETATREPLIETVWKMLVNAHSYCYPYFKAYFNDHHALTAALLPLFNNQIQDIWLKSEGYDTSKGRLYGGLLGDTRKLLADVDNCVAASRYVSQYPWFMSRPMKDSKNKWRRRRDADTHLAPQPVFLNKGKELCMFDPDDPVAFLGKPVCT